MPQSYTMMGYDTGLFRTVYWTSLFAPDFVGDKGPYVPANLEHIRVKLSRSVQESGPFSCPSGVSEGDFVYFTGSNSVDLADSTVLTKSPAVGVVVNKPTTTSCLLAHEGKIDLFSGLTPGSLYFLGVSGAISSTAPSSVGEVVQRLGVAINVTSLLLTIFEEVIL